MMDLFHSKHVANPMKENVSCLLIVVISHLQPFVSFCRDSPQWAGAS
jgi:hypothetical protein